MNSFKHTLKKTVPNKLDFSLYFVFEHYYDNVITIRKIIIPIKIVIAIIVSIIYLFIYSFIYFG